MNPQDDVATVFAEARPDDPPPGTALDIKQVMRDGYRARRRNRAAVAGAAAAGVCAVAVVLAFSVTGLPGPDTEERQQLPAADFGFDPALAGYPSDTWDWGVAQPELQEAANDVLGGLAVEAGFVDAAALEYDMPSQDAVEAEMAEQDLGYFGALSELGYLNHPLQFSDWNTPGNAGQVQLRGYVARDGDEEADRSSFTVTAMQPGGWTAEPGPTGEDVFPQHLLGDEASWSETAPEFTSEDLDDGRTLIVADHGCALEAVVVYPNASALKSTWDVDCEGQGRDLTVEQLSAAMLAMPQIEYDTSELRPITGLVEVPPGWPYSEDWETEAAPDADASIDAATAVLDGAFPGVELTSFQPNQADPGYSGRRAYAADYKMPFEDASGYPVHAHVRYYLPGGWLPGLPPEGSSAEAYLLNCGGPGDDKDDVCEETEVDGRMVVTRSWGLGDSVSTWVAVYDPAGWAVEFNTMAEGDVDGYAHGDLVALAASLPAPVYDPQEYER
ncbi:hypothetical protein [Glycomyces algeriensis]|uniref:Uncharacterized protein n=1 Tax=Glycomyces algeriensis TaxID=256037 RepID=A0A9W6LGK7_9ACTN|nr:hypothetical protein [Glycomyces algeriensis]MDA1364354.1 hypothetical protein [Glycomyces algeriensis]MDR7350387.1 hypothetical protein [Glycomyces algeriensis]GLI43092.1 hypothetical protein GALLR39Z86_29420 [Glycomyces algeriensis]